MNIVMITNTFTPHVGGVARSVEAFTGEYRRMGHRVLVVAPEFPDTPEQETGVVRVPALTRFNDSDFSIRLPLPAQLTESVAAFEPDIIHSHHPFLLGGAALRLARQCGVPLVFTHHTMYEHYAHYASAESPAFKRFAVKLSTGYSNLCDCVFAPSESVALLLRERGVRTRVCELPTGVNVKAFDRGDGGGFRRVVGIPEDAFVVGHVGRLAPEKNLSFLADAAARYLQGNPAAQFLLVGTGPSLDKIQDTFANARVGDRVHYTGSLSGDFLVSAYKAMDVFAFASQSETQGMVLTEAMAAGVPVVAVDAPGVREVLRDGDNGRALEEENRDAFVDALAWVAERSPDARAVLRSGALETAQRFSMEACAARAIGIYEELVKSGVANRASEGNSWDSAVAFVQAEWDLLSNVAQAAGSALRNR